MDNILLLNLSNKNNSYDTLKDLENDEYRHIALQIVNDMDVEYLIRQINYTLDQETPNKVVILTDKSNKMNNAIMRQVELLMNKCENSPYVQVISI